MESNSSYDEKIISEILINADNIVARRNFSLRIEGCNDIESFNEYYNNLNSSVEIIDSTKENRAWQYLENKGGLLGKIKLIFKKILRKYFLKWYIEPICNQQTDFNKATFAAIDKISVIMEKQLCLINELMLENRTLNKKLEVETASKQELERKITHIEKAQNEK